MRKITYSIILAVSIVLTVSCGNGKNAKDIQEESAMEMKDSMTLGGGQVGYGVKSISTNSSESAHQCNVCSCKQYSGGSGTSDKCACGHERHKHYWY